MSHFLVLFLSKQTHFVCGVCLARCSVLPVVVWKAGWCTWTGKKPGFVLPATVHLWMVSDMKLIRIVINFPLYTGSFCTSEFPRLNHFTGVMSFFFYTEPNQLTFEMSFTMWITRSFELSIFLISSSMGEHGRRLQPEPKSQQPSWVLLHYSPSAASPGIRSTQHPTPNRHGACWCPETARIWR